MRFKIILKSGKFHWLSLRFGQIPKRSRRFQNWPFQPLSPNGLERRHLILVSLSHSHGSFILTLFFLSPFLLITLSDSLILSSVKPLFDSHVPLFSLSWSLRRCGSVGKQSWWVWVWIGVGSCGLWAATSWVLVWVGGGGLWILVWIGEVGLLGFEQRLCGSQDPNLAELAVIGMGFFKKIVDLGLVLLWVLVLLLNVFDLGMFEVWCWMIVFFGLICVWLSYYSFVEFG